MFDFEKFDDVFAFDPKFTYPRSDVEKIEKHRKSLEGQLFVDRVLQVLSVDRPSKHYPPKTNSDLRSLHASVIKSDASNHTKHSLLYYLLLDSWAESQREEHSERFQEKVSLPKRHQIFMKGLWHMDRLEFEMALQYLTHPSLIPTFHEEILQTLIRLAKHDKYTLALSYYYTVQPTITSPKTIEMVFSAIIQTNVVEAFYFQRGQSEHTRHQMFEMLISHVMKAHSGEKAAARAIELINLPFSIEEEQWFEDYLSTGNGRHYQKAKDTLMMRRIATGRYAEALSVEGMHGRQIEGLNWAIIQNGLEDGLGPRLNANGAH